MESKPTRYYLPDLEASINKQILEHEQVIIVHAKRDGQDNQPPATDTDISPYLLEHHLFYQGLLIKTGTQIPPETLLQEMKDHEAQTDKALQDRYNVLSAVTKEGQEKTKALSAAVKPTISKRKITIVIAVLVMLFLVDAIITAPAFQTAGFTLFECFCIATGFAFILYFAAHYYESTIQKGSTKLQKRLIAAAFIIGVVLMAVSIAVIRARYFISHADGDTTANATATSVLFVLFSLGAFGLGVGIRHYHLPSAQRAQLRHYEEVRQAKSDTDAEKARVEEEIKSLIAKNDEVQTVNRSVLKFGADLEQQIINAAKSGHALYIRHNMMVRPNRERPICFNSVEYPLQFDTIFSK